ncbi:MAG: hypothetical protein AB8F95_16510 [Bacteroidia bacterium]
MKKSILLIVGAIILAGFIYGWYEFNRGHESMESAKADVTIQSTNLHQAFANDEEAANQQYVEKIIEVTGTISSIISTDAQTVISLEGDDLGGILCSMSEKTSESVKEGTNVTIVGLCTGALGDADIGLIDVNLVRCIIK